MNKTLFFLARHGETIWNKEMRFQGHLDSKLTSLGVKQSQQIANQLQAKGIDAIISSPLGRAQSTAKICQKALDRPYQVEPELIERHLGVWQGQRVEEVALLPDYCEILQQYSELSSHHGESAVACHQRIQRAFHQIAKHYNGGKILVIFHGEALRCFLAGLGKVTKRNAYEQYQNGCIIKLTYHSELPYFHLESE
ncbi:histidine phosphatase family protein [Thalassotalea sp. 1_MG-2023]|uniref:histidine phosphatase family protein n=1 Tax=Thalassotalea sp. 1_MG-2023 TaxID=3062680 RepID=UPI0026E433B1|nr:histidine phosphatase family protein [Thalassotalea sp. 1_MG-2023]MDO6427567.1 histidine phosphatase family protein [Thalassotalea sp. 1_MG-2023]